MKIKPQMIALILGILVLMCFLFLKMNQDEPCSEDIDCSFLDCSNTPNPHCLIPERSFVCSKGRCACQAVCWDYDDDMGGAIQ